MCATHMWQHILPLIFSLEKRPDRARVSPIGLADQQKGFIMYAYHTILDKLLASGPRPQPPRYVHGYICIDKLRCNKCIKI